MSDYAALPPDLPVPEDDGAADHLVGMVLPSLILAATPAAGDGENAVVPAMREEVRSDADLAAFGAGRVVVYVYPRTGVPGVPLPDGWDDIPGARGCTPQSCAYRDALAEFERLGAVVVGISAQSADEQAEFAQREHIPFPLLSDPGLELAAALRLPTFAVDGMTLYKRLTFVAAAGRIAKVFYPVFPPDRNAAAVLDWLAAHPPPWGQAGD
jgi:peroxiredoxin